MFSVWLDTTGREVMVRRPFQYDSQGWPRQAAGDIKLHKDQVQLVGAAGGPKL
jgi:hypothetical protein